MQVGDIVTIHDGSWHQSYLGDGRLARIEGLGIQRARRWRVVATGENLSFPTDPNSPCQPDCRNDTMLCEDRHPDVIVFTSSKFCEPDLSLMNRINALPEGDSLKAVLKEIARRLPEHAGL